MLFVDVLCGDNIAGRYPDLSGIPLANPASSSRRCAKIALRSAYSVRSAAELHSAVQGNRIRPVLDDKSPMAGN